MPAKVTRTKEQNTTLFTRAAMRSLALVCLAASVAGAQIGGPNSGARKEAKEKESKEAAAAKPGAAPRPAAPSTVTQRFEREGVAVDFTLKSNPEKGGRDEGLVAGADAVATFRLTDARTGAPLTGYHPNAWISSRAAERGPSEGQCKDKITTLLGGLLSERAEVDLNGYSMLTLNHDNTITFINPQLAFNVTKMESIVVLPGSGADWTLSADKNFLYVTIPEQSSIAVIDTTTRKLAGMITIGGGAKPRRVALQPDGRYVWVALDDVPLVAVIDTHTNKLAKTVDVGAGIHSVAFTDDSRFAYVTNSVADTVTAIDARTLAKVADIQTGKTPGPVAYSKMGRLVYVAAVNGGVISAIDPATQRVVKTVPSERGVVALRFEQSGRFGFVVNQPESTVSILDASTNAITGKTTVTKEPDQVTFTDRYAYVRGTGSEKFTLIELKELNKGRLAPVDIQAGTTPANAFPEEVGVSGMIAPTPEGNSVMVASTADQSIFYYAEGLMAPVGDGAGRLHVAAEAPALGRLRRARARRPASHVQVLRGAGGRVCEPRRQTHRPFDNRRGRVQGADVQGGRAGEVDLHDSRLRHEAAGRGSRRRAGAGLRAAGRLAAAAVGERGRQGRLRDDAGLPARRHLLRDAPREVARRLV
jgi:YVTN family beta-propeller protein